MAEFKKEGRNWFGKFAADTDWHYIGTSVTYKGGATNSAGQPVDNVGLYQPSTRLGDLIYESAQWDDVVGHWAHVILPTARAESQYRFDRINTYDNVNFTFGFLQQAAHTEDDNLALFMRLFLAEPEFAARFPDLTLVNNRVHQKLQDGTTRNLEKAPTGSNKSKFLMEYLNVSRLTIDENEKLNALRFIRLTRDSARFRELQVKASVAACQKKLQYWPHAIGDNTKDTVLSLVISQLHWRGGAHANTLRTLQSQADPVKAIVNFIKSLDANRGSEVERGLKKAIQAGYLGQRTYNKATKTFS